MLARRNVMIHAAEPGRRPGHDRRVTPKYPAGGTAAVLAWQDGVEYRTIDASLVEISLHEASALAGEFPPAGVPLWFRVRGDQQSPWIGVAVTGASRTGLLGLGPRSVRLEFAEPCPYDVFKAAIADFTRGAEDTEFGRGGLKNRDGFR